MSKCLMCKTSTTRTAKIKAGRYTLCDGCVALGADIRKHDGVWKVFYKGIPQGRCAELLRCAEAMDFTD